jgi:hypothetical protein
VFVASWRDHFWRETGAVRPQSKSGFRAYAAVGRLSVSIFDLLTVEQEVGGSSPPNCTTKSITSGERIEARPLPPVSNHADQSATPIPDDEICFPHNFAIVAPTQPKHRVNCARAEFSGTDPLLRYFAISKKPLLAGFRRR